VVFAKKEKHCHRSTTKFQGHGEEEGREGKFWMVYRGIINTFDERQRHSHDPGWVLVVASDRNAGARVDDRVLWPEVEGHVAELVLEFESFANDIVPGLTAELFRVVATFGPAYVVQVGWQESKGFGLARGAQHKCVRVRFHDILIKEVRGEVLAAKCK